MLTIPGHSYRLCDGLTRRNFLRIGGLALGGLSLPEILRAESAAGSDRSHKAIIMIFLPGGPPHQDMFDLKLDAPRRNARRVPSDQDQRAGHRNLRALSAAGHHDGPRGDHPLDRRRDWRTRRVPVPDRTQPPEQAARAVGPRWVRCSPSSRGRLIRRCRRLSACRRRWGTCLGPMRASPASWAWPMRRSSLGRRRAADDMVLQGMTLDRLSDRRGTARQFRPLPPRGGLHRHDGRARRVQRSRLSAC